MTTRAINLPFGEWLPDLPSHENPGALIAENVIPQLNSFASLKQPVSFTNALASACLGSMWAQNSANTVVNFAGDAANLYRLDATSTWQNVNGVSAPYSAENWDFTKFGSRIIAANKIDPLQYFDIEAGATFIDLPGNPPQAARIATVRDFVVVGDLQAEGPNVIGWSGYNNSETWVSSLATQADKQELFGRGGRVQRIVPGEYGVIFQEHSIYRMDYSRPPIVFQIDEVERKQGTPAPNSVVWYGGFVFYRGWNDFNVFDGQRSQSISANKCSLWFNREADASSIQHMRGAVDRLNKLILWSFRSNSSLTYNDRLIIFNLTTKQWSYAKVNTQIIDEYVSPGYNLDTLSTLLTNGIDIDSFPVDSSQYKGGVLNLQVFDTTNRAATLSGAALPAVIDTTELSAPTSKRLFVNDIRPLVENAGAPPIITASVGQRNALTDNPSYSAPKGINSVTGTINTRINSRYQRYRVNINGDFKNATGVRVQARVSGGKR